MKRYFKKFFITIFITLLTITITILQAPTNIFAFGSASHEKISQWAYEDTLTDLGLKDYLGEATRLIVLDSVGPDIDESGGEKFREDRKSGIPYRGHFFDGNIFYRKTEEKDNALTRMVYHFDKSVEFAIIGEWEDSTYELARAFHYLQDMCCPVHIWGFDFNSTHLLLHQELEKTWDEMWRQKDKIGRYINRFGRLRPEEPDFESAEDLGIYANRKALEHYGDWIADKKRVVKNILPFAGAVHTGISQLFHNPLAEANMDPDKGFRDGWRSIFDRPYLATCELVRLWVNAIRGYNPPQPDRGVCILQ